MRPARCCAALQEVPHDLRGNCPVFERLFRGNDPEAMTQAWAVALADIPYAACARGVVKLAQTMKFPPSIAEICAAAKECMPAQVTQLDKLLAITCHEELGLDTPLYRQMQVESLPDSDIKKLR